MGIAESEQYKKYSHDYSVWAVLYYADHVGTGNTLPINEHEEKLLDGIPHINVKPGVTGLSAYSHIMSWDDTGRALIKIWLTNPHDMTFRDFVNVALSHPEPL